MEYHKIPISEFTAMFQSLHFGKARLTFANYKIRGTSYGGSSSFLLKNYHKEPFHPASSDGKQRNSVYYAISIDSPTFKTKIIKGTLCPTAVLRSDLLWPSEARLPLQMKWRRRDCRRLHVKPETIITVTQAESSRHRRGLRRLKPASEWASERGSERLFR